jgi:hypothetical protein
MENSMSNTLPSQAARPEADEYNAYYAQYINRIPEGLVTDLLAEQLERTRALLLPLTPAQVAYRPKPDDWNIAEVLGHIADSERIFAFRALAFARNDTTALPSFDQDLYVANADFAERPFDTLIEEYTAVRRATLAFFGNLPAEAWVRRGVANHNPISVRALAYIIAGHELHHVADFRDRYRI